MLRKALLAAGLLAVSTGALADRVYARVVTVEPNIVISYSGGGRHDGFRVLYEFGGRNYWTVSPVYPGPYVWVPGPVYAEPAYYGPPRSYWGYNDGWRWDRREWDRHDWDRRGWGRRDGGRDHDDHDGHHDRRDWHD